MSFRPKQSGIDVLEHILVLLYPPVLVSENLAAELQKKVPSSGKNGPLRFQLRNAGRTPEVSLLGTVEFSKSRLPLQDSHVVVMELTSASYICYPDDPGNINQIGVTLTEGADQKEVQKRLQDWLGARAQVQTVNDGKAMVSDVTAGLNIGFGVGGAVALVVGLFLVYNILSVSVAERRHDIGILRSVGATRGQIARLFVGEAMVMGLVGSSLGLPLGWQAWLAGGQADGSARQRIDGAHRHRCHRSALVAGGPGARFRHGRRDSGCPGAGAASRPGRAGRRRPAGASAHFDGPPRLADRRGPGASRPRAGPGLFPQLAADAHGHVRRHRLPGTERAVRDAHADGPCGSNGAAVLPQLFRPGGALGGRQPGALPWPNGDRHCRPGRHGRLDGDDGRLPQEQPGRHPRVGGREDRRRFVRHLRLGSDLGRSLR